MAVKAKVNTALGVMEDPPVDLLACVFCGRIATGTLALTITLGPEKTYTFCCREHGLLWADRVRRLVFAAT